MKRKMQVARMEAETYIKLVIGEPDRKSPHDRPKGI